MNVTVYRSHFSPGDTVMPTKLAEWMRLASKEEKEELARRADTSVGYLRLLAYGHRENPKVRLALAISRGTWEMAMRDKLKLPVIELHDLAVVPNRAVK
jgi:hypothetical protein